MFNPRWIVGKTVEQVDMNPFDDGKGGTAHDPRIWFTDGTGVAVSTEETEVGEYGTALIYLHKNKKRAS